MCTDWLKLITINDPITASMIDKKVLTKAYSLLQFNDSGVSKQIDSKCRQYVTLYKTDSSFDPSPVNPIHFILFPLPARVCIAF